MSEYQKSNLSDRGLCEHGNFTASCAACLEEDRENNGENQELADDGTLIELKKVNLEDGKTRQIKEDEAEVEQLIERRDALKKGVEQYAGEGGSLTQDWEHISSGACEEEILTRFQKMLQRIYKETPALGEVEDTIGRMELMSDFAEAKYPTKVQFDSEKVKNRLKIRGITEGAYNVKTDEIMLRDQAPSQKDVWVALAYGDLPSVLKVLDHELNHFWYYQELKRQGWQADGLKKEDENKELVAITRQLSEKIKNKIKSSIDTVKSLMKELRVYASLKIASQGVIASEDKFKRLNELYKELYSLRAQRKSKRTRIDYNGDKSSTEVEEERKTMVAEVLAHKSESVHTPRRNSTIEIIEKLVNGYGFKGKNAIDCMIITAQAVDRFRVLGLSDKEIAEFFGRAEYDEKTASFPLIEQQIERIATERGFPTEDLDYRVDLMRIEKELHLYQAANIAQEELKKFAHEKREKNGMSQY